MTPTLAAQHMRSTFRYTAEKVENWRIMKDLDQTGKRRGDCEDFALTTLWLIAGQSALRFWWLLISCQAFIWYVKSPSGVGHAELWVRGAGWIDNIFPTWSERPQNSRRFPYIWPLVVLKMLTAGWPTWRILVWFAACGLLLWFVTL